MPGAGIVFVDAPRRLLPEDDGHRMGRLISSGASSGHYWFFRSVSGGAMAALAAANASGTACSEPMLRRRESYATMPPGRVKYADMLKSYNAR